MSTIQLIFENGICKMISKIMLTKSIDGKYILLEVSAVHI